MWEVLSARAGACAAAHIYHVGRRHNASVCVKHHAPGWLPIRAEYNRPAGVLHAQLLLHGIVVVREDTRTVGPYHCATCTVMCSTPTLPLGGHQRQCPPCLCYVPSPSCATCVPVLAFLLCARRHAVPGQLRHSSSTRLVGEGQVGLLCCSASLRPWMHRRTAQAPCVTPTTSVLPGWCCGRWCTWPPPLVPAATVPCCPQARQRILQRPLDPNLLPGRCCLWLLPWLPVLPVLPVPPAGTPTPTSTSS